MGLSEMQIRMLLFETSWRTRPGGPSREDEVRERFDLTYPAYTRQLAEACAHPDAIRFAPAVVARHRAHWRRRGERPDQRSESFRAS